MKPKNIFWIFFLAFLIRIVIAFSTYHPDVRIVNFTSAVILRGFGFNIYDNQSIKSLEKPDDLPLQYWIRIPLEIIFRPLINQDIEDKFLLDTESLLGDINLNYHLLIIKLPLIIFDLSLGYLIYYMLPINFKNKGAILWLFNPLVLWTNAGIGQVDVLPTFFLTFALFFLFKERRELSIISLGVGGALKSFPFLIAPLILLQAKSFRNFFFLSILLILPLVISVAPYLFSSNFRSFGLFSPQLDKILYSKISLSGGEAIYIVLAILIILFLFYRNLIKSSKIDPNLFLKFSTISLLSILAFTHFHIQWIIWVIPFLIILFIRNNDKLERGVLFALYFSVLLMLFLFESSLTIKLFSPLFPWFNNYLGLYEILAQEKINLLKNLSATIFVSCSIFLSYRILIKKYD